MVFFSCSFAFALTFFFYRRERASPGNRVLVDVIDRRRAGFVLPFFRCVCCAYVRIVVAERRDEQFSHSDVVGPLSGVSKMVQRSMFGVCVVGGEDLVTFLRPTDGSLARTMPAGPLCWPRSPE